MCKLSKESLIQDRQRTLMNFDSVQTCKLNLNNISNLDIRESASEAFQRSFSPCILHKMIMLENCKHVLTKKKKKS